MLLIAPQVALGPSTDAVDQQVCPRAMVGAKRGWREPSGETPREVAASTGQEQQREISGRLFGLAL